MFSATKIAVASGEDLYEKALAAIPNKTVLLRADKSAGTQGQTLTNTPWVNEGSLSFNCQGGAHEWQEGSLNGLRGVEAKSANNFPTVSSSTTWNSAFGGDTQFTIFAVEKRSQNQGGNSGNSRYGNGVVWGAGDWVSICFEAKQFYFYDYANDNYRYAVSGYSFTDDTPYVIAFRANSGTNRWNFNGSTSAGTGNNISEVTDSPNVNMYPLRLVGAGTAIGYEYIISSSAVTNTEMDDMVAGLMYKWGI